MLRRKIDKTPISAWDIGQDTPQKPKSSSLKVVRGVVGLTPRGFGFVTTEAGETYFIASQATRFVLNGDAVQAEVTADAADRGEVLRFRRVERKAARLVCELKRVGELWQLVPDEPCFKALTLSKSEVAGLSDGDVVAVSYPAYAGVALGRPLVVQLEHNLGKRSRPGFLRDYVTWRYGFEKPLPTEEAEPCALHDDIRQDLRHLAFVTIDGESTLDIDDAIFVQPQGVGVWDVYVAIADVSSTIHEGSPYDRAAFERSTSLYLAGKVLPMLPEFLSNSLLSLQEGRERRALVMQVRIASDGSLGKPLFYPAWVKSAARLTYTQVATWMAGGQIAASEEVQANLQAQAQVYPLLLKKREVRGMLDFDEPQPTMRTLPDGTSVIEWEGRTCAHRMVELYMLLANTQAAEHLAQRFGVAIFRQQPRPRDNDWLALRNWVNTVLGLDIPKEPDIRALAQLSQHGDAQTRALTSQRVRIVMRPANYAAHMIVGPGDEQVSHFALGVSFYTHFTSPIRRYVDLAMHRLLLKPEGYTLTAQDAQALYGVAQQCAERSLAARQAERYLWDQLKLEALSAQVTPGDVLDSRLVRLTGQGARVYLQQWQLMGWLPATQLKAAGFSFDGENWVRDLDCLQEGVALGCQWLGIVNPDSASPELHLKLAA